ncbi:Vacuolar protein-sorting-associated protein 27 [Steccherinum ochraceum]|uniref:Vacuolar protein sorting-associated protein 27 n=1 Tax=Steccherinum ochraceum TaxID=92696 RepID=A0A4R0RYR1_9APHY|nr:Vacuolar protein-sorting-associated protein 27 [Steccherinum ochraceum]
MTSLFSSLLWGTSQLDDAIDRATSELLPSGAEDIALNLEICDQIRSKSVPPKDAMRALKRRLNHKNPNVQLLALSLTDTCIKNGGDPFLIEITSREFMDNLVSILKIAGLNHDVKTKILRLVQNWSSAFEGKGNLSYVGDVYRTLQREGFNFPPRDPAVTSSAMVDTQTAPEWIDSDVCLRCRTAFSFTNRKHHCRNCGLVFDQQCSSKTMALPHFGITQEVRVCDSCHIKLSKKSSKSHRSSQSVSGSRHRAAREATDADLQRAIQLSLEEVGAAGGRRPGYVPSPAPWQSYEPPLVDRDTPSSRMADDEDDPELKAAIEASLREASAPRPSAPMSIETPRAEEPPFSYGYAQSYPPSSATPKPTVPMLPNYDLEPVETDAILTFSQTVDQIQAQGGRDLSRYPAVNELFDKANGLRPKLAMNLSDTGRKEELLSEMHEKLSQAVRLYDKLLTEQVSHPSWRAASAAPPVASTSASQPTPSYSPSYQVQPPSTSTYNPSYQQAPPVSYNQWQPQNQVTSPPVQAQQTGQPSYFASQAPVSQQQAQSPIPNGAYASPTAASAYYATNMYQAQSPQNVPSPQQVQSYASPVASPPVSIPQYGIAQQATGDPILTQPALVSQPPPPPTQVSPQVQPVAPPPVQSPPIPSSSPTYSTLARHNTLPSHQPAAPVHSQYAPPARPIQRSNTVAVQSHAPQQLQQLQQIAAPPQIPVMPAVPAASPSSYDYQNQVSGYAPPEERKEALLIDL